ncbi:MAG: hypothetical protein HY652_02320 [Acidobacteria bacterium]|nr:hypothetical protein [Acidobacteriota bacterium]
MSAFLRSLFRMWRGHWLQAQSYQRSLYSVGALLLLSALFHAGVLLVTGGSLQGDVSWRKPILFGESFGLTCWSVAWIMTFLPRRAVVGWLLSATLGLAGTLKVPHALAVHAPQVLPLLAGLLWFTSRDERWRTRVFLMGAAGYTLVIGVFAVQALNGLAPLDLSPPGEILLGTGILMAMGAYAQGLAAVRQAFAPGARPYGSE